MDMNQVTSFDLLSVGGPEKEGHSEQIDFSQQGRRTGEVARLVQRAHFRREGIGIVVVVVLRS
jgi:hypothetical protein